LAIAFRLQIRRPAFEFESPLEPFDSARRKRDAAADQTSGAVHRTVGHRAQGTDPADTRLDELLGRISHLMAEPVPGSRDSGQSLQSAGGSTAATVPPAVSASTSPVTGGALAAATKRCEFVPLEPANLEAAGISEREVTVIALKFLHSRGAVAGRDVSTHLCLPFTLVQPVLAQMKLDQWVVYRGSAHVGDYVYELTVQGREQARRQHEHCTYCGAAPVSLADYVASVRLQSIDLQRPEMEDLQRAMSDFLLSPRVISQMAQAIRAGRGLFLYGPPGNGKTSVAERISLAFGQHIWIPQAIGVDGDIIRLFDPCCHEVLPLQAGEVGNPIDARWIRIRRPTVVVGGELTMDRLEVTLNRATGTNEAPVQMKSNCGVLVIDDFGRQRMPVAELLNRWIVPLQKRHDYLNLPSGKTIQIPFDQLIVFSTNLEPRSLADEAFLRRIPYKIDFVDPSEDEFRELMRRAADSLGFVYNEGAVEYLLQRHYRVAQRPLRSCQPRDLLLQVKNFCDVHRLPVELTARGFDVAVKNYFATV
jgi:predicted ATPase with chaperone activity